MTIEHSTQDGVTIISPVGRIDTTTSSTLEEAVRQTVNGGTRELVVDFSRADYISSAGLRVFLVLAKRLRELHGRLVLCAMGQPVQQVFQLAGFMPIFMVEASRSAALLRLTGKVAAEETAKLGAIGGAQP